MTPLLKPVSDRVKARLSRAKEGDFEDLFLEDRDDFPDIARLCRAGLVLLREDHAEISGGRVFDKVCSFLDQAYFIRDEVVVDVVIKGRRINVADPDSIDCDSCGSCFEVDELELAVVCPRCGHIIRM